ncbi:stress protein [Paenibacillus radicis (ex Xue et al. 2023)]|uniref:Stress protein n=1 Tax=Paenibacillus radicis (ex Xue et al. 2023) TaxID=2972489 RepID=A0ABT1YQG8_9BACL|nr:stress protein [Paenibacillus radicis (ex Xue et al. 2023)]MCR8634604.1 stress protein [Paenibacillus radicis (ex Xue et al. 2023)]
MKSFLLVSAIAAISLIATGCGSSPAQPAVQNSAPSPNTTATAPVKKEEPAKNVTLESLVQAFKNGGVEAETPAKMEAKDYGAAPKLGNGMRIFVPSLGKDSGGRVLQFDNKSDLEGMKKYYDDLGKASAIAFSHTYAKGLFLLQMNGTMKEDQFIKYKEIMDKVIK